MALQMVIWLIFGIYGNKFNIHNTHADILGKSPSDDIPHDSINNE